MLNGVERIGRRKDAIATGYKTKLTAAAELTAATLSTVCTPQSYLHAELLELRRYQKESNFHSLHLFNRIQTLL